MRVEVSCRVMIPVKSSGWAKPRRWIGWRFIGRARASAWTVPPQSQSTATSRSWKEKELPANDAQFAYFAGQRARVVASAFAALASLVGKRRSKRQVRAWQGVAIFGKIATSAMVFLAALFPAAAASQVTQDPMAIVQRAY